MRHLLFNCKYPTCVHKDFYTVRHFALQKVMLQHTVKNSKNNILQSSIRQNTKKHKILNTAVVFFIWLLQLFGPTFVFLN